MPDFNSAQNQLAAARSQYEAAMSSSLETAARASEAQTTLDLASRRVNAGEQSQELAQLRAVAQRAAADQASAKKGLQSARTAVSQATISFGQFNTPQQNVNRLNDSSPFLLFPVRIETRFRVNAPQREVLVAASQHELLVRIYPDDCSIDTFEPLFSTSELANIKAYWMNMWRAGAVENDQRGAWSRLVAAQGSGRAGWLADNYQPINAAAAPVKVNATDEILVIPTSTPLSAAEANAISAYWSTVWISDSDPTQVNAASATLAAAVGNPRAAQLISDYAPFNLDDAPADPLTKKSITLSVVFVVFPPDPATAQQSWTQAPQVRQFPERFVVLGFNGSTQTIEAVGSPITLPLYTGPDPSADPNIDPTSCIHPENDGKDLFVPDQLQWMVDFDRAVAAGMALVIPLTAEQYTNGFTRLIVLGLQLGLTSENGPAALQELLAHHQYSRSGLSLLPQGTPTHNSSGTKAATTPEDDADSSFDDRANRPLFSPVADPTQKRDGQWLAEFLRIDPAFVAGVHGSGGSDQLKARAMQTALWPATLGYWMDTLFTPDAATTSIFSDAVIEATRSFFTNYVSGRGALPAIRIAGQPYGILPVTAFSGIKWFQGNERLSNTSFLASLYKLLRVLDTDWTTMSQSAAWVGKGDDAHQTLLDVVGLNPSSIEYYSRNAESRAQVFNMFNRFALGLVWAAAHASADPQAPAITLLQKFGYSGAPLPSLLDHYFLSDNPQITTIIDDLALSETNPIRFYTPDNRNYIQWLVDAATQSLDSVREESGFTNNQTPQALLYLWMRHALMLGYYNTSYNLHSAAGFLSAPQLLAMRVEPTFVHVAEATGTTESRFGALYKVESRITGSPTQLVSDYITARLFVAPESAYFASQVTALQTLVNASTAQLERAFAEHIDTCSYRYDAWLLALVNQHIQNQLATNQQKQQPGGLYLGAYAWVEDLRPSTDQLIPAQLPPDLAEQFAGDSPLMTDAENGGYIHAPSIPHADTAAVLRAGFIGAQADGSDPGQLAVNLSSDRVRVAMSLIEGIRNGQSLGALLGYQFEVGLHDSYGEAEVDKFIYPLRKQFPLVADSLASTKTSPDIPIEAIEARNVVDGKKLVDQITLSKTTYPWGVSSLPPALPKEQTVLDATAAALMDAYDAIADLALAESVYQAVQGNYDRVASTIAAYTTGNFPPEPGIVETSPPGFGLTHRFGIQFRPGLAAAVGATPRAQVEPAIDEWLSTMLPPLDHISCTVAWTDPVTGNPQQPVITLADLGLRPIDALYLLKPDNVQAMAEMDDRIQRHIALNWNPRPDALIQIQYMTAGPGDFSIFEVGPLLRSLRALMTHSRPLRASDVLRANDATQKDNSTLFVDQARISTPLADLTTLAGDIDTFLNTTLAPLLADTSANRSAIITQTDSTLAASLSLLERAARLAVPSSGWGFLYQWRQQAFIDLFAQIAGLVKRWTDKLANFKTALIAYDALPGATSDTDRFAALQAAELIVSSSLDPLPATPLAMRSLIPAKATAMQTQLNNFVSIQKSATTSFATLLSSTVALSTKEFDSGPFDVSPLGDRAITVTQDISRVLTSQLATAKARIAAVNAGFTLAASAGSTTDKATALVTSAKALMGDDFQIVPEFTVSANQGGEWVNALNASTSNDLFTYLQTDLKIDFPIDEWFYSAARVREPLRYWESALMLASAFGLTPPPLTLIQLPFSAGEPWRAMQFPETPPLDGDRLIYTCLYSETFNPAARQCGVMVDEWTEVIPASTRDTGVTFNYNRPDNEPPQAMLLVVSASNTGSWQWTDLVGALNETLDLAKKRAVEPALLDPSAYSRFLPATVTASTSYGITIATPLTAANRVIERLERATE